MASVLIVDDDVSFHRTIDRLLWIRGHPVIGHAYNGVDAIEMIRGMHLKPDLILMDYRMPMMDGICATREIINMIPGSKIFFLSADDSVKAEAFLAGAIEFLTKPIRSKDLFAAIEKQLFTKTHV